MNKLLNLVIVLALLIGGAASVFAYQENSENGRLSGVAEQLQEEASQLRRKIEEAAGKRMELEAEKKELQTKLDSSANWLIARRYQLSLAGDRITNLEDSLGKRGLEVEALEAEREQLRLGLQAEVAALKAALTSLQKQNADLKKEVGVKQGFLVSLNDILLKWQIRIASLEAAVASLQSQKLNLESRIRVRENQIVAIGQSLQAASQFTSQEWNKETALLTDHLVTLAARQKSNPNRIVPVYFVPSGLVPRPNGIRDINRAMAEVQAWFSSRLEGKTFEWDQATGVMGKHPYAWYQRPNEQYDGAWESGLEEVAAVMPRNTENTVYLIFFEGWIDPVATGLGSGEMTKFRFGFFGKDVMEWLAGNPLQRRVALGSVAHEIIHGLLRRSAHDPEPKSIMHAVTGDVLQHSIIGEYRSLLERSPFLR